MFRKRIILVSTTVLTVFGVPPGLAKTDRRHALLFVILIGGAFLGVANVHAQVDFWLTDPGGSARFEKQKTALVFTSARIKNPTTEIVRKKMDQTNDGFW